MVRTRPSNRKRVRLSIAPPYRSVRWFVPSIFHVDVDSKFVNTARYLDHAEAHDAGKLRAYRGAR